MRRVVVTGLGLLTPLGWGVEHTWKGILEGRSGIGPITSFDTEGYGCTIAGEIPSVDGRGGGVAGEPGVFDHEKGHVAQGPQAGRRLHRLRHRRGRRGPGRRRLEARDRGGQRERTGVMVGSGIGGLGPIAETAIILKEQGPRRVSPFFIPIVADQPDFGPDLDPSRAQGAEPFGRHRLRHRRPRHRRRGPDDHDGRRRRHGGRRGRKLHRADRHRRLPGLQGPVHRLSTTRPRRPRRPYDKDHAGFIMGEGAGIMVLEEYEHAKARGAKIYAEVVGYGMSGDAYHITAPSEDGNGGYRAMQMALKRAGMEPSDIDYVNAHGTSTMADWIEAARHRETDRRPRAERGPVLDQVHDRPPAGRRRGHREHLLACWPSATRSRRRPSIWTIPRRKLLIELVPHKGKPMKIDVAMSNSFGFGGTNATVIFKKVG
jgi:3-oxoacyl-[acyl-carrier-protein] synthase II